MLFTTQVMYYNSLMIMPCSTETQLITQPTASAYNSVQPTHINISLWWW